MAEDMMTDTLNAEARRILAANDRGGYTVPTAGLYPFQWNWDSAFVAMGFALYDTDRALAELERLTEGQWLDGMIPHIIFHQPSDSYFPGPEVWRTSHVVPTSGITQPPVLGMAVGAIADRVGADDPRIATLFDAAMRWHRWWYAARDPEGTGLVAILHPWESGSDNSPAWDAALARVPTDTVTPVRRKDTGHVNAAMRPTDQDYARFIHLVDAYAAAGWDPAAQWTAAPFKVACVQTTAILLRAGEVLEPLAVALGRQAEADELAALNARTRDALLARYRPALRRFVSRDLLSGEDITAPTQAGFIPLLALDLAPDDAAAIAGEMAGWCDGLLVGFPTTRPHAPGWEPKRYWRGPAWPIIDWLLIDGLTRNGHPALAETLRRSITGAIAREGFVEYFDPVTGEGCGGQGFSWSAAAWLHLARPGPASAT